MAQAETTTRSESCSCRSSAGVKVGYAARAAAIVGEDLFDHALGAQFAISALRVPWE